jgi:glycosyltransferase involved in cell wall biosynthesis
MITTTRNGALDTSETETEERGRDQAAPNGSAPVCGFKELPENRLNGTYTWPPVSEDGQRQDALPPLALLCYEGPTSAVGRFVSKLAAALARRRRLAVHLFSRTAFEPALAGVSVHEVGDCGGDYLPEQVEEFTGRACNAFLAEFPDSPAAVPLLGFEWPTAPALSLLHGIKRIDTTLSLHSLERQRSDLSSEASRRIDEIEQVGLREAKALLLHDPATGELAASCVPGCADRIVYARKRFPEDHFAGRLDPGEVKARYQVGPTDPMILYVGDLDERYGPDLLVKAMPAVLKNHKQARLVVVGDGGLYWPLRVYARYLLLEHAVRLPGHVEGPPMHELMQAADVVVVPSRVPTPWWPFQAAWAARRPVVATHHAAPGILEHEQNSVLVFPSENSLVWGIERVLFDAELGRALGEKGYETLEERFGWNTLAAQMEEIQGVNHETHEPHEKNKKRGEMVAKSG